MNIERNIMTVVIIKDETSKCPFKTLDFFVYYIHSTTNGLYIQWGILLCLVSLLFLVRVLLQLTKIGKVVIMLTLFGKLLLIDFCGDYPPYSNSFCGLL